MWQCANFSGKELTRSQLPLNFSESGLPLVSTLTKTQMYIFQILEQVRRRNAAEQYYIYAQSEEGKAAAVELDRLRAACDAAESNYLALCARFDAERAAEVTE